MKKLINVLLVASLALSCIGCSNTQPTPNKEESKEETKQTIETKKGLINVTITIPADLIGEEKPTQEELDKEVKEKGFKSATLNEDGSVTYVMSKSKQKQALKELRESIEESLSESIGGEQTPNITDIKFNDDFTDFTIYTKNTELDFGESFFFINVFLGTALYNYFAGNEDFDAVATYKNADSDEEIESLTYKEWEESFKNFIQDNNQSSQSNNK